VYLAGPRGEDRLFAVERGGKIRLIENGVGRSPAFLDLSTKVNGDVEGGMLGLVFAPDFATSGVFYVYYTGFSATSPVNMQSVVSRFTVVGDPATSTDANEASETPIFTLDQPYANHNAAPSRSATASSISRSATAATAAIRRIARRTTRASSASCCASISTSRIRPPRAGRSSRRPAQPVSLQLRPDDRRSLHSATSARPRGKRSTRCPPPTSSRVVSTSAGT
jgi:hypothetical protein